MNKETINKSVGEHALEASGVNAQPCNRKEQIINDFATNKDKIIRDLQQRTNNLKRSIEVLEKKKTKGIIQIQGILTSNLRIRKSTDVPYMAFFRPEYNCASQKHSWEECERTKCQSCEIPVIFRLKDPGCDESHFLRKNHCWIEPNLKKGDSIILAGEFSPSQKSNRPSFTCYNYTVLKEHEQ